MSRVGTLRGVVLSQSGQPLADVNVMITDGPTHVDLAAITDSEGKFSLGRLKPGSYTIKAFGPVESDPITVRVLARRVAFVEIWLDTGPVETGAGSSMFEET